MNATITINTTWSQVEYNSLNRESAYSDVGSIQYNHNYISGSAVSGIDTSFHEINTLAASGGLKIYNLASMTGVIFGNQIVDQFSYVKSFTLKNLSTESGARLDMILHSGSGFDYMFGQPSGKIEIYPSGMIHSNTSAIGYPVSSNEKFVILKNDTEYPCYYELCILGNR